MAKSLQEIAQETIQHAYENRGASAGLGASGDAASNTLEGKMLSNLRAVIPEACRPSSAGWNRAWRASDAKESWSSTGRSGVTANACRTAHDFCEDVMFPTGMVPFRASAMTPDGQNIQGKAAEVQTEEERVEKRLDWLFSRCDAIAHFMLGWDASVQYGDRYFHVMTISDPATPSRSRPTIEAVDNWECSRDMDNDGPLEDGEYFNRRQRLARRAIRKWAEDTNAGSLKRFGAKQIDMVALNAAFTKSSGDRQGAGTMGTADQKGTPQTDDLVHTTRTECRDELWRYVPRETIVEWNRQHPESVPVPEVTEGQSEAEREDDAVYCMISLVNDDVVGVLPEPGELPYRRGIWHRMIGCRDALGIPDLNSTNQATLDGLTRAMENDLKTCRKWIAFLESGGVDQTTLEQMMQRPVAYIPVRGGGPLVDIGKSFAAGTMPSDVDKYIAAIQHYEQQSERDTGMARPLQGDRSGDENRTAWALKQRLENAGRHLGSKIRGLDADIVWCAQRMLQLDYDLGNFQLRADMEIHGGGFRAYARRQALYEVTLNLLQMAEQFPDIKDRMRIGWVLTDLVESAGIDPEKFWLDENEYQQMQQAKTQSPQAQAQQQQMQLAIDGLRAKAGKDDAQAQKFIAEAQAIVAGIGHADSRLQTDRAKAAVGIAAQMRGATTRADRRAAQMEPSATVRMAA